MDRTGGLWPKWMRLGQGRKTWEILVFVITVAAPVVARAQSDPAAPPTQAAGATYPGYALPDRPRTSTIPPRFSDQVAQDYGPPSRETEAQTPGSGYSTGAMPSSDGGSPNFQFTDWSIDLKDGFLIKRNDGQFSLRINNLLQADYRDFTHTADSVHGPTNLQDQFTIAREWIYFRGNTTEFVDYQAVLASGSAAGPTAASTFNLLDAFLDFNFFGAENKEKFQFRVGRFKTPFMYQFYVTFPIDIVTPELSMFATNYVQNRQVGAMVHGLLFEKRIEYAAGVFNGAPNTWEVEFSNREWVGYLGYAPFLTDQGSAFQNLLFVSSAAIGRQFGPTVPSQLSTATLSAGPPNSPLISPTFVFFDPAKAIQNGNRAVWDFELLWAYKSFNFYGEFNGGSVDYGLNTAPDVSVPVSLSGWSATATYFLTGEEVNLSRRRIQPLRPYNWKNHTFGAVEAFGRFSNLVLGSNAVSGKVITPGSATGVNATDIGANWFLNPYIRIVFDWQHAMFNGPVALSPVRSIRNEDMFWTRFQMYY